MVNSFSLILMSALFMLILIIYFTSKEHISTLELKLYKGLLLTNFVGLILEMGCYACVRFASNKVMLTTIVNKVYLIYFVFFGLMFTLYTILVSHDSESYNAIINKYKKIIMGVVVLVVGLVFYLPIQFHYGDSIYSYGAAVNVIYGYAFMNIILCVTILVTKFKNIKRQKYAPLIFYIIGSGVVGLIQYASPELTLSTTMDALVLFVMYFTIENPD
jgi:hypothetical protein